MSDRLPWFPFYAMDWISSGSVAVMSPAERGAYIQLLAHSWLTKDCGLPNDPAVLATLSGLGPEWNAAAPVILDRFRVKRDRIYDKRLLIEYQKTRLLQDRRRAGGKKTASRRWSNSSAIAQLPDSNRSASSTPYANPQSQSHKVKSFCSTEPRLSVPAPEQFAKFWQVYPRKVGKRKALAVWRRLKLDADSDRIIEAVLRCKTSADWQDEAGKFIPHPTTWLNRGGWDDELDRPKPTAKPEANTGHRANHIQCTRCLGNGAYKNGHGWARCNCPEGEKVTDAQLTIANAEIVEPPPT